MSTEIAPIRESEQRSHPAVTGDADPFKNYRMGSDSGASGNPAAAGVGTTAGADSIKPRTFLPTDGQLTIPPLNYGDASLKGTGTSAIQPQTDAAGPKTDAVGPKTDNASTAPTGANKGYDHVVQHKDSLWKIAETSLGKNADHKASPHEIWNQVQNIVKANKNEHPQLQKNPHMLHDGIKLHIPEPNKGGDHQSAAQGQGHAAVRPPQEGHHERKHQRHNPSVENGAQNGTEKGSTQPRKAQPDHITPQAARKKEVAPEVASGQNGEHPGDRADDGGRLAHAIKQLGRDIAKTAVDIAHSLGTIGDCARGPRLAFKEQGLHLKPAVATEQGRQIRESGLFTRLKPGETPQPGDYGVRDWNRSVIRAHGGVNKGDSFIVTSVAKDGTMHGANDHRFVVPPDGGRYRNLQFYRPNAEFLKRYGNT